MSTNSSSTASYQLQQLNSTPATAGTSAASIPPSQTGATNASPTSRSPLPSPSISASPSPSPSSSSPPILATSPNVPSQPPTPPQTSSSPGIPGPPASPPSRYAWIRKIFASWNNLVIMVLAILGMVYGYKSFQSSDLANGIAARANDLAERESCRSHPHDIALQNTMLCQEMRQHLDYDMILKRVAKRCLEHCGQFNRLWSAAPTILACLVLGMIAPYPLLIWRYYTFEKDIRLEIGKNRVLSQASKRAFALIFEGIPNIEHLHYFISVPVGTPYRVIQQLDHEHDRLYDWVFFLLKPWGFYGMSLGLRAHNGHGVFPHPRQPNIDDLKTCTSETWICLRMSQYNFDETPPVDGFLLQPPTLYKDKIVFKYAAASVNSGSLTDGIPISSDDEHVIRVVLLEKKRLSMRKRLERFGALLAFSFFIFALYSALGTLDLRKFFNITGVASFILGMVGFVLNIVQILSARKASKHTPNMWTRLRGVQL